MFFLTFISLFSSFFYLARLNTNNKRHFLTSMLTTVYNFTFPSFNLSMFTEDGNTINNEDRKQFYIRTKMRNFN